MTTGLCDRRITRRDNYWGGQVAGVCFRRVFLRAAVFLAAIRASSPNEFITQGLGLVASARTLLEYCRAIATDWVSVRHHDRQY
jgi:hypothetical protein